MACINSLFEKPVTAFAALTGRVNPPINLMAAGNSVCAPQFGQIRPRKSFAHSPATAVEIEVGVIFAETCEGRTDLF